MAAGVIGALALLTGTPQIGFQAFAVACVVFLLAASRSRLAPLHMSPLTVASGGLLLMALVGVTFYGSTLTAGGGSADVVLTDAQTAQTQNLLATAGLCVLVGGLFVVWIAPQIEDPSVGWRVHLSSGARRGLLFATALPLLVSIALSGTGLIARNVYLESEVASRSLLGLASQLALAAVIALGYLAATSRGSARFFVLVITVAYLLLFFAGGSRRLAMLPALFALGLLMGKRSRPVIAAVTLSIPLSIALIGLALFLRGQQAHGLLPYMGALPAYFSTPIPWDSITRNIFVSFGIVGATAFHEPAIDPAVFWVSINPLPGTTAGWYDEAAGLRINAYTPYAGIGELGNYGSLYVVGYCLIAGIILGTFERQVRKLGRDGLGPLALIPVGLAGLFVLYAVQYNLRTASRMLVYGVAASVALAAIAAVARRRQRAVTTSTSAADLGQGARVSG